MKRTKEVLAAERIYTVKKEHNEPISAYFGENTFNLKTMREKLPEAVFKKLMANLDDDKSLDLETANIVAHAMKEWAIENGATHYAHWFQPMTGATAEKHDAFIEPTGGGGVIERFSGKQLVQGEPDASSFPSGGIRATFEARGYTTWDMSSPAFLRKNGLGTTLCIPTAFISYTGEALDKKTPLLRSVRAVNSSALNMLKVLGNTTSIKVASNLGPEQEYFLIDIDYFNKRQDLVLAGRSLVGAPPAKGQELDDQYFGSIKERIQSFMHDVEEKLYMYGIPAKTRHNEVAPSQFEIAPMYEDANLAVDHNQLVMDTLQQVAKKHGLACLLNEKPFARINGSGKHLNWSLSTDDGINLLNPGKTPHENIQFLVFLIATIRAVYMHSDLLRAAICSSGNDHRLGANEAPPAIISVFLGEQLSKILQDIESGTVSASNGDNKIDLGISSLTAVSKDNTDRNRTSPFAFTGNKFEFRAVGSSQSIAFSATVLNTIVAESLDYLAEKIKSASSGGSAGKAAMAVIKEEIPKIKAVLFDGDNYSEEWHREAENRGLPNLRTTPDALPTLVSDKAVKLFGSYKVYSEAEIHSRYTVRLEKYAMDLDIETRTLYDMVSTQIIPAAVKYQKSLASSLKSSIDVLGETPDLGYQKEFLKSYSELVSKLINSTRELKEKYDSVESIEDELEAAKYFCGTLKEKMDEVRKYSDVLETLVDDEVWPLPKYWEILFIK